MTALTRPIQPPRADADIDDVALAAAGDQQAFARVYQRNVARIHSLARRMLGPDDAEEATQDVFVRAWQKLDTFRGEAQFSTWLHRLAVNVILGRRGKRATERERWLSPEGVLEHAAGRSTPAGLRQDLDQALARLPEGARTVFVLHDVEGYRHEEIAQRLGVTAGTSKSQLHRARMALRELLVR